MVARVVHVLAPDVIRRAALSRRGSAWAEHRTLMYDSITFLTALTRWDTSRSARFALCGLAAYCWVGRRDAESSSRIAASALAEEVIWREGPGAAGLNIAGFAALHRHAGPVQVIYHTGTGALFTAAHRLGGLPAATLTHAVHNVWVVRRRRAAARQRARHTAQQLSVAAPSEW